MLWNRYIAVGLTIGQFAIAHVEMHFDKQRPIAMWFLQRK